MSKSLLKRSGDVASFETLVRKVKDTFFISRQRIKQEMVRTYWQTGQFIHEHILCHQGRAGYGEQAIPKLSERVGISRRSLQEMLQVYRKFPKIGRTCAKLEWSHLRKLASVKDLRLRAEFSRRAIGGNWTSDELAFKISAELRSDSKNGKAEWTNDSPDHSELIRPKLGTLYTYRLVSSPNASIGDLKIDQGFSVYRTEFDLSAKFKTGDIVESERNRGASSDGVGPRSRATALEALRLKGYTARKSKRDESDLFTYQAFVIRIVDGDTLVVEIDLGFTNTTKQYLRLRGIDCPEIDTTAGRQAKEFVISALKPAPFIFLASTRSDKYDRYLADVFIPGKTFLRDWSQGKAVLKESEDLLYLNNELLRRKLASRM